MNAHTPDSSTQARDRSAVPGRPCRRSLPRVLRHSAEHRRLNIAQAKPRPPRPAIDPPQLPDPHRLAIDTQPLVAHHAMCKSKRSVFAAQPKYPARETQHPSLACTPDTKTPRQNDPPTSCGEVEGSDNRDLQPATYQSSLNRRRHRPTAQNRRRAACSRGAHWPCPHAESPTPLRVQSADAVRRDPASGHHPAPIHRANCKLRLIIVWLARAYPIRAGPAGSTTSRSRSNHSNSNLIVVIATALAPASKSGSA